MQSERKTGSWMPGSRRALLLRLMPVVVIVVVIAAFYVSGLNERIDWDDLIDQRLVLKAEAVAHPVLAVLIFVGLYVAVTVLSLPLATMLTIFGGFLFGWLPALLVVPLAATLGASCSFLVARGVAGGFRHRVPLRMAERFREGFARHAFTYLLVLRLAPFCPFMLVNVAPAFFGVRLATFMGATLLGVLPGTAIYAWLGSGLEAAIGAAERRGEPYTLASCFTPGVSAALGALAVFALLPILLRPWIARRFPGAAPLPSDAANG